MCARVAGILAPLIGLLGVYHKAIPMIIYGSLPFLGGALCFMLPETLNTELADHTEQEHDYPLVHRHTHLPRSNNIHDSAL